MEILCLPTESDFISFSTNGLTTYNGHSFANITQLKWFSHLWEKPDGSSYNLEEIEQIKSIRMEELKGKFRVAKCHRLEELQEGMELIVCKIQKICYRNVTRYILQFDNIEKIYVSNYWLEKEINDLNKDLSYKLKIKLGKLKTTPAKNKQRVVFCV